VAAGATVETREWPENLEQVWVLANTILSYEAALIHSDLVARAPDRISDHLKELVANGQRTSEGIYASAREKQELLRNSFSDIFTGIDVVLSVPAFGEAPSGLSDTGDAAFCTPWTFLGVPAITLSVGFGPAGLPLGIQLTGAPMVKISNSRESPVGANELSVTNEAGLGSGGMLYSFSANRQVRDWPFVSPLR
jgi:amidase